MHCGNTFLFLVKSIRVDFLVDFDGILVDDDDDSFTPKHRKDLFLFTRLFLYKISFWSVACFYYWMMSSPRCIGVLCVGVCVYGPSNARFNPILCLPPVVPPWEHSLICCHLGACMRVGECLARNPHETSHGDKQSCRVHPRPHLHPFPIPQLFSWGGPREPLPIEVLQ